MKISKRVLLHNDGTLKKSNFCRALSFVSTIIVYLFVASLRRKEKRKGSDKSCAFLDVESESAMKK